MRRMLWVPLLIVVGCNDGELIVPCDVCDEGGNAGSGSDTSQQGSGSGGTSAGAPGLCHLWLNCYNACSPWRGSPHDDAIRYCDQMCREEVDYDASEESPEADALPKPPAESPWHTIVRLEQAVVVAMGNPDAQDVDIEMLLEHRGYCATE